MWCYLGSEDEAETVIQSARDVAEPLFEHIGPMPYPALRLFDDAPPVERDSVFGWDLIVSPRRPPSSTVTIYSKFYWVLAIFSS